MGERDEGHSKQGQRKGRRRRQDISYDELLTKKGVKFKNMAFREEKKEIYKMFCI